MHAKKRIAKQRERREYRVRNRLKKAGWPRLSVYLSNKHVYAQIIDDRAGGTLVAASTVESTLRLKGKSGGNKSAASRIGQVIAERAVERGIQQVTFDRGMHKYHGRVAALADAARQFGLTF